MASGTRHRHSELTNSYSWMSYVTFVLQWDDVAGLKSVKDALKQAVIFQTNFPQFYTGTAQIT